MISIYQGNEKWFSFTRRDINGDPITTNPQGIWFTVKNKYDDIGHVIQKTLDNGIRKGSSAGEWLINIYSVETENIKPGKYVCDVKIRDEYGTELTIVKPQDFVILPVVTQTHNQYGG